MYSVEYCLCNTDTMCCLSSSGGLLVVEGDFVLRRLLRFNSPAGAECTDGIDLHTRTYKSCKICIRDGIKFSSLFITAKYSQHLQ